MRFVRALALSSFLVTGVACGGGDLGLPEDQSPADITVVAGNGQVGAIGSELSSPLVVRVDDVQGRPVPGVRVAYKLGAGAAGGSTAPDTAVTNADGEASSLWVLGGGEGRQTVDAEVVGEALVASFFAQAERTSTLTLERTSGNQQSGEPGTELADPLVVRLVDENGDGVAGSAVAWVVATGGGAANPETSNTDDDGFATTRWTLGAAAGENRLNAVVSGVGVVSFTATAGGDGGGEPSAELSTVTASPASIEAGTGQSTITVTVRDGQGTPIEGATVTLSASGNGNLLTQPSGPTGSDGVTTGSLGSVIPETKVVTAVVNGAVALTQVAEVTVTLAPAEPDHLVFRVQPTDTEDDEPITPAVEVAIVDENGDLVTLSGVEIEIEFVREERNDPHRFDGEGTRTTVDGIAVFPDLSASHDHDDFRLRASAPGRPELGSVLSDRFAIED
ncbi:MAG: Ig-like domain-containing protein [Gemmatimonadales bacterium]